MDLEKAKSLALELMDKHGLLDDRWHFEFSNKKNSAGTCNYRKSAISLSAPITALDDEDAVRDTILHEIAHALCPNHGHDLVWQRKAEEIGCNGLRCFDMDCKPSTAIARNLIAKYKAVCVNGHEHFAHRISKKRTSCGVCSRKYDERFILEYKPNI